MNNRYTKIILVFSIFVLIIGLSTINATDVNNNNTVTENTHLINNNTDTISHESIRTPVKDVKTTYDSKNIKKENENKISLNSKNYDKYFDEDGFILNDEIKDNTTLTLNGEFEDKDFHIENVELNIVGQNALLKGTTIEVLGKPVTISNITINNTNKNKNSAIIFHSSNCILENSTIIDNTTNDVKEIYITGDNNTIRYNTINVGGSSDEIDWYSDPDLARTLSIAIVSNNNLIQYNNINTYTSISKIDYGAVESITIQGSLKGDHSERNIIEYNNIHTNGTDYAYGVNLGQNIDNNIIRYNNITTIGRDFADSIQAFSAVSNLTITYNNITSKSDNWSDAIALSKDNMNGQTHNNTIIYNNLKVTGYTSTLIDTGNLEKSVIEHNIGHINATKAQGFIITGSQNNVKNNTITLISGDNSTTAINLQNTNNNSIQYNCLQTNTNYTISVKNAKNNNITNNKLQSLTKYSNNAVYTDNNNNIIRNNEALNKLHTHIILNNITAIIGSTINITAKIIDENGNPVQNGKAVFKINGKTIRDSKGNVIYLKVSNGTIKLSNYKLSVKSFSSKKYTIQAVYGETDIYKSYRSQNITLNIIKHIAKAKLTTNSTLKTNSTVIFRAKITDENGNNANSGKAVFKLNGKTLRYSNGTPIKVKIQNGVVSLTYKLPEMSTKQYKLTVVFSDKLYSQCEDNATITLIK